MEPACPTKAVQHYHFAASVDDPDGAWGLHFEGLVMRSVFLGLSKEKQTCRQYNLSTVWTDRATDILVMSLEW